MDAVNDVSDTYWYTNRHALKCGQIFRSLDGSIVRLVGTVPGDGTKWYVDTWDNGWFCEDETIEPGDLRTMPLPEPTAT